LLSPLSVFDILSFAGPAFRKIIARAEQKTTYK
jgi:hypothetical protein